MIIENLDYLIFDNPSNGIDKVGTLKGFIQFDLDHVITMAVTKTPPFTTLSAISMATNSASTL